MTYAINLVSFHMPHHARQTGYDMLTRHINGRIIGFGEPLSPIQHLAAAIPASLAGNRWYGKRHFLAEMRAAVQWAIKGNQIFHFLYGENSFRYLGSLKNLKRDNKIVATFHVPPDRLLEFVKYRRHLKELDAAIVVSTRLLPFYRHVLGNDRVFFVPLGVDLGFFCPTALPRAEQAKRNFSCLFVGQYLRDFDVLARVASILASEDPRVTFHVVTSEASHHHFLGLANVTVHESIPDGELLCLYRSSDLFVFPLLDCTANCSLLEALACGLPVITTDLTGTRDYLDLNCAVFTPPGDAETMAQAIVSLVEHPRRLRKMAVASRARARQFSWPRVANQVTNVYRHLYRDTVR